MIAGRSADTRVEYQAPLSSRVAALSRRRNGPRTVRVVGEALAVEADARVALGARCTGLALARAGSGSAAEVSRTDRGLWVGARDRRAVAVAAAVAWVATGGGAGWRAAAGAELAARALRILLALGRSGGWAGVRSEADVAWFAVAGFGAAAVARARGADRIGWRVGRRALDARVGAGDVGRARRDWGAGSGSDEGEEGCEEGEDCEGEDGREAHGRTLANR